MQFTESIKFIDLFAGIGGIRKGFEDTRGMLFFEVERILRDKKPKGFILEKLEVA